jgi:hypothetical protein
VRLMSVGLICGALVAAGPTSISLGAGDNVHGTRASCLQPQDLPEFKMTKRTVATNAYLVKAYHLTFSYLQSFRRESGCETWFSRPNVGGVYEIDEVVSVFHSGSEAEDFSRSQLAGNARSLWYGDRPRLVSHSYSSGYAATLVRGAVISRVRYESAEIYKVVHRYQATVFVYSRGTRLPWSQIDHVLRRVAGRLKSG